MTFCMRQGLLIRPFDGQGQVLLFDPVRNLPYVLNRVAAHVLMNTNGRRREEVAEEICMLFDVEYNRAMGDLEAICVELRQKDLIVTAGV
jgi:hypothetical protein